ncbi:DUF2334 domain-containing protein [Patescibacteria group bacterium]|nr:DUF2334 domain-containing protein [Patescibacteria group bacterium]MBU1970329.1 DUF2334 domain-containing protein [Patescibacteria group bacterium]
MRGAVKQAISALILALVVLGIGGLAGRTFNAYVKAGTNLQMIQERLYKCTPFDSWPVENEAEKPKVILRIDDIQAYYDDTVTRMIDDAFKARMKVVIGVIPNKLAEDKYITSYINRNKCNLEIALHGWDHSSFIDSTGKEVFEFQNLEIDPIKQKIWEGKNVLESLFESQVVSFIPPGNSISNGTKEVLVANGFKVLSSEGRGAFDYSATTYDWDKQDLVSPQKVLDDCAEDFKDKHLCVIMMHMQDFETNEVIDEAKYANYLDLLALISKEGYQVVTFKDIYADYANYVPPEETDEYLMESNETLWDIAVYYYNDGRQWGRILEKNRDKIKFLPNGSQALVEANTRLVIPIND